MPAKNRHEGKTYDLDTQEVADLAGRTIRWVHAHKELLGGVKRAWVPGNGRESIRFHGPTVRRVLKERGIFR